MSARILVVADDRLARAGLAKLLSEQPDYIVAGQITSADAEPAVLDFYRPDVVLWDTGWRATSVLEQLANLCASGALVVALLADETHAAQVWSSGVRALVERDVEEAGLYGAMTAVLQGLIVLSPRFAGSLSTMGTQIGSTPVEPLTAREQDVLHLLAEGLSNKAIAQRLGISEHTVKFHINALLGKLGVQSRTEAVVHAMRLGLVSL